MADDPTKKPSGTQLRQTQRLASLLEVANAASPADVGKCVWVDRDGNEHCNNWTEFQCEQFAGEFSPGERCER